MLKKLIEAVKAQDYIAAAACFEDSRSAAFVDYCPINLGYSNYHVIGSVALEMFFRDKFYNHSYSLAEEELENDENATFFGCYNGSFCFCRMTVEEKNNDGLIKRAVVRPV